MTDETSIDHIAPSAEFWIAHGPEAVHYGQLAPGEALSSGLPSFEIFAPEAEADWRARLVELGVILPDPPPEPLPPWLAGAEADKLNPIGPVP